MCTFLRPFTILKKQLTIKIHSPLCDKLTFLSSLNSIEIFLFTVYHNGIHLKFAIHCCTFFSIVLYLSIRSSFYERSFLKKNICRMFIWISKLLFIFSAYQGVPSNGLAISATALSQLPFKRFYGFITPLTEIQIIFQMLFLRLVFRYIASHIIFLKCNWSKWK